MTVRKRKSDIDEKKPLFYLLQGNRCQLFLFLLLALLAVAVAGAATSFGSNEINNEKNEIFEEKWKYCVDDGEFTEVTLPSSKDLPVESRITLKNHLPTEMVKGATVLLRTSQQDVEIEVGDALIYSSRNGEYPVTSHSSSYHFVRLPTDCAGEPITVILSSPYENYVGFMSQIYIGSKASNLFFLLHENGLRFIIGFLVFSVGFLLMLVFLFAKGGEGKTAITNLGAFFTCAGYWLLAESHMMQFVFPYPMVLTNSSIFALTLLPVFSGIYYYTTQAKMYKKIARGVIVFVTAASLLYAVVAIVAPMEPIRIFPYYLGFLMLYLILIFAAIISESVKAGKFFSVPVCGVLVFTICALCELVFYFSNMKTYNQSNFLTAGLLLFCVSMVVDSTQNFTRVQRAAVKVDALSVLAYQDSLTGLQNRTAFLEEFSTIDTNGEIGITVAMYDINNLKIVNDTKGHLVGDALLRHCGKAIKSSLRQEDKVYRIGGDEFVAILRHDADFNCSVLEERLLSAVEKENQKTLSYTLNIAYGFATYKPSCDRTIFDTQARADERMYICKRAQKSEKQVAKV